MILTHNTIKGKYAEINPLSARDCAQFPRHSATLLIKLQGRQGYIEAKLMKSQAEAIAYCRAYNYNVPVGF